MGHQNLVTGVVGGEFAPTWGQLIVAYRALGATRQIIWPWRLLGLNLHPPGMGTVWRGERWEDCSWPRSSFTCSLRPWRSASSCLACALVPTALSGARPAVLTAPMKSLGIATICRPEFATLLASKIQRCHAGACESAQTAVVCVCLESCSFFLGSGLRVLGFCGCCRCTLAHCLLRQALKGRAQHIFWQRQGFLSSPGRPFLSLAGTVGMLGARSKMCGSPAACHAVV